MTKPIIGVMPLWDDDKESIWMLPGYFDGLIRAGGTPVMFPFLSDKDEIFRLMDICDGILFTGGHDVSPAIYGEEPMKCVSSCKMRDDMEGIVLEKVIETNKPLLGICRGIQFINAYLGGTLYQDIKTQYPSDTEHHQEGLYMPGHPFLWAIQWHPEFSFSKDDNSLKIFSSFIEAAG